MTFGELLGLLELLEQHAESVAYDCIRVGVRLRDLGSDRLTWDDLLTIVRQGGIDTALYRATNPDDWHWTPALMLLAEAVDMLRIQVWQLSGGSKKDFPKPIPRPGVASDESTKYGSAPLPMDEMAAWLGWA